MGICAKCIFKIKKTFIKINATTNIGFQNFQIPLVELCAKTLIAIYRKFMGYLLFIMFEKT
jgi:hypothetical protein